MKKNRVIALCAAAILSVTAVIGGTMAYFTDTDDAKNTFTVGNVKIALHESNGQYGKDYATDEDYRNQWLPEHPLMPTDPSNTANVLGKEVTVKNTGASNAYLWTEVWIPAQLDDAEGDHDNLHLVYADGVAVTPAGQQVDENEVTYNVYKVYAENGRAVAANEFTPVLLEKVYMDKGVTQCTEDHEDCYVLNDKETHYAGSWELKLYAFGIQADGFADMDAAMEAYYAE